MTNISEVTYAVLLSNIQLIWTCDHFVFEEPHGMQRECGEEIEGMPHTLADVCDIYMIL
jgi:hypothetical protein